ncbi:MAG TPA: hypothetical protein VFD01_12335 [Candidatus Dormibacteraeota bacterium]|nr:hypothetical protein [Candidatus Dormibacteraeota bacterium]
MPRPHQPPPWALEWCPGCARYATPEAYELSRCCSCGQCRHDDQRRLFAVAWICDRVIETVDLFTR